MNLHIIFNSKLTITRLLIAFGCMCFVWSVSSSAMVSAGKNNLQSWQIAVLGDSDSQSYQSRLAPAASAIGGKYAAYTLQWTEVLERLGPSNLKMGAWGQRGTRRWQALLQSFFGLPVRTPNKEDFEFNFAFGGAACSDLNQGLRAQLPLLLKAMDSNSVAWQRGIVVIRMGINDFGMRDSLDQLARDPNAPTVLQKMNECVTQMKATVAQVHQRHPKVNFVIAGIFDNRNWPAYVPLWQTMTETRNISQGLDRFDGDIKGWVRSDSRLAFFDERALFQGAFGSRDVRGFPDYKSWSLGGSFQVRVTQGDRPDNIVLENGHSGLAYNILWAQKLVETLNTHFSTGLPSISSEAALYLLETAYKLH